MCLSFLLKHFILLLKLIQNHKDITTQNSVASLEIKPHNYKTIFCKFYGEGNACIIQVLVNQEIIVLMPMKEDKKERRDHLKITTNKKILSKIYLGTIINFINTMHKLICTITCSQTTITIFKPSIIPKNRTIKAWLRKNKIIVLFQIQMR